MFGSEGRIRSRGQTGCLEGEGHFVIRGHTAIAAAVRSGIAGHRFPHIFHRAVWLWDQGTRAAMGHRNFGPAFVIEEDGQLTSSVAVLGVRTILQQVTDTAFAGLRVVRVPRWQLVQGLTRPCHGLPA